MDALLLLYCYRGASPLEQDNQGMTPLHYACSAGRPRNVDILLKKAKEGMGHVFLYYLNEASLKQFLSCKSCI